MNHLRNTYCIDKNLWSCIITPVLWLVLGLTILYYWTCCPALDLLPSLHAGVTYKQLRST